MEFFTIHNVNEYSFRAELSTPQRPKPIKWMPHNKQHAEDMFSDVQYSKGSAVILMLEHILGDDVFHDGVGQYLKAQLDILLYN